MEAILDHASRGEPDGLVRIDGEGGMALHLPGKADPVVLYP
jgi:hypothetical protein